jgi:hypothetical protein
MTMTSSTADAPFEERLRLELLALHEERFGGIPAHRHSFLDSPRHRLVGMLASSAAVVTGIALIASGVFTSSPERPSAVHHHAATATTTPHFTTAYVLTAAETKLADTSNDVLEVQSDVGGGVTATTWMNSATGQFKTLSVVNGQPAEATFLDNDKSASNQVVTIDYTDREWWSVTSQSMTMSPETPQDIANELSAGAYTLVGPTQVNGENTLELTSTRGGATNDLWVDAATYLPVKFVSGVGTSTGESSAYTWTPAAQIDTSIFNVSIPSGFQQLTTPPSGLQPGVTGKG